MSDSYVPLDFPKPELTVHPAPPRPRGGWREAPDSHKMVGGVFWEVTMAGGESPDQVSFSAEVQ